MNVITCPSHNFNVGLASLCLQKIPLEAFRSSRVCAELGAFIFYIVMTQSEKYKVHLRALFFNDL